MAKPRKCACGERPVLTDLGRVAYVKCPHCRRTSGSWASAERALDDWESSTAREIDRQNQIRGRQRTHDNSTAKPR